MGNDHSDRFPFSFYLPNFGGSVVLLQHLFNSLFGIEEHAPADDRVGDLPGIAQGLQRAGGNVQVLAHLVPGQVAFAPDRRGVVLHRLFYGSFGLAEQREGLPHLVALRSQIVQRHGLLFLRLKVRFGLRVCPCHRSGFPHGSRFEIGGNVAFLVEILAAHIGIRDNPFFAVALQRPFGNVQREAHVLRVDSTAIRSRFVPPLQLPRFSGQCFHFSDKQRSYPLVDTKYTHNTTI